MHYLQNNKFGKFNEKMKISLKIDAKIFFNQFTERAKKRFQMNFVYCNQKIFFMNLKFYFMMKYLCT